MCKGAVGFGHLVSVFLLLEGNTSFVVGINDDGNSEALTLVAPAGEIPLGSRVS